MHENNRSKKNQDWGAGAGCFWLLGAGAAWKKKSGAGAAKNKPAPQSLYFSYSSFGKIVSFYD